MLDAFTQCGTTPCLTYIIEAIRDYDEVKTEHMAYLLNGISAARNAASYLFDQVIVSNFVFLNLEYLHHEDFFTVQRSFFIVFTLMNLVFR